MLPLLDAESAVMLKCNRSRILDVVVATCCGLLVSLLIKIPVNSGNVAKLGLVPGKMGFNPGDPGDLVLLRKDATPKIAMLIAMN